ncbi:hypothetical protein CC78DRAFT_255531 [Lojkania enalia]|uniref:Rhodopsin domain-containing protein n=1 Tax=Lojkania enalia TaxID=147567 RepID=A0A9P4KDI7_9PLEO|nr:hypothetical protein CC78DRAFT_255531 [Didymosphaeria enalia]
MSSIDNHLAPAIIGTAYAFTILGTFAIALRFVARYVKGARFGLDDWTMLAAYSLFVITMGMELRGITAFARIERGYQDREYSEFAKYIYLYGIPYHLCVCILNISILLIYRRIFTTKWFTNVSMGFICLNILWGIPAVIVSIWACNPISSWWKSPTPTCIHYGTFWVIIATFEVFIQFCMMILPVNEVRKLQLTTARKVSVSAIFMLGGLAIISGIVRIAVSYKNSMAIALDVDALWLNIHLGIAVVSACLPTYKPLVSMATDKARSYYSYVTGSNVTSSIGSSKKYRGSASDEQKGSAFIVSKTSSKAWERLDALERHDGDNVELVGREDSKVRSTASTIV